MTLCYHVPVLSAAAKHAGLEHRELKSDFLRNILVGQRKFILYILGFFIHKHHPWYENEKQSD